MIVKMENVSLTKIITEPFKALRNITFARLYFAQIASGRWVG